MALKESLEKNGAFLFRYRGQLPLLFILFAIVIVIIDDYSKIHQHPNVFRGVQCLGIFIVLLGHLIRFSIVGSRFAHTSGRNRHEQVAHQLNTKGWYSMVRHPLYFANFLIWFGITMYLFNPWLVFVMCLCYWLYYERIMYIEESFLIKQFGDEYLTWSRKVPAFFPAPRKYMSAKNSFSWKSVLRNEYPSVLSTLCSLLLLTIIQRSAISHQIDFTWVDLFSAVGILILGLIFRFLKHRTTILKED